MNDKDIVNLIETTLVEKLNQNKEYIRYTYYELKVKYNLSNNELDSFLTMTHKEILRGAGTISHEKALKKAHEEYDKYMRTHLTQAEKDYLEIIGEDIKKLNG